MSKRNTYLAAAIVGALFATSALAPAFAQDKMKGEKTVMVGGAPMFPSKNIVQNAVNSKDHTTLVAAVKAAGLVDTLLKPENKGTLTTVLTYHVVPGRLTAVNLMKAVKDGNGEAKFKTVAGGEITVKSPSAGKLTITDAKGGTSTVTINDVLQSNGVIHVIDTVLLPS